MTSQRDKAKVIAMLENLIADLIADPVKSSFNSITLDHDDLIEMDIINNMLNITYSSYDTEMSCVIDQFDRAEMAAKLNIVVAKMRDF